MKLILLKQKCYCRHHELAECYDISIYQTAMYLFSFDVGFFFPLSPVRPLPGLTIRVILQVSHKRKELLTLHEHYGKPSVLGRVRVVLGRVRVAHHISLLLCE